MHVLIYIFSSGGNETVTEEDEVLEELVNLQDEAKRLAAEAKAEAKPQNDEEWLRDNAMKSLTPRDKGSEEDKKDVVKKRKTSNDVYLEAMQEKNKVKREELKLKQDELEFAMRKDELDRQERRRQEERNQEQQKMMMEAIMKLANK